MVVAASIVGTPAKYEHVYDSDGATYPTRADAISAGFRLRGSDDFNIGILRHGRLVELAWMDERIDEDQDTLDKIAAQLGLAS